MNVRAILDEDVARIVGVLQTSIPANKLLAVAQRLAVLAPILREHQAPDQSPRWRLMVNSVYSQVPTDSSLRSGLLMMLLREFALLLRYNLASATGAAEQPKSEESGPAYVRKQNLHRRSRRLRSHISRNSQLASSRAIQSQLAAVIEIAPLMVRQ